MKPRPVWAASRAVIRAVLISGIAMIGPVAVGPAAVAQSAAPVSAISVIPDDLWAAMQGRSWRPELPCPPRASLRVVETPYRDFGGAVRQGRLIVHAGVAEDVRRTFLSLFEETDFRIFAMRPVSDFDGDDDRSMAANNTSAFNCRTVGGSPVLSQHAYGVAIDINPIQNPFVTRSGAVSPPAGDAFAAPAGRTAAAIGVIVEGGPVTAAFDAIGWGWGGRWTSVKDYQHFSINGR